MLNCRPKISCMYCTSVYQKNWDRVCIDIHDTRRFRVSCSELWLICSLQINCGIICLLFSVRSDFAGLLHWLDADFV